MTRTIPAPLASILTDETASLSTILELRRRDRVLIRLTEADIDISINGQVFLCNGGYERTAFSQSDGLEVDDLKITGHFDANAITEDDVRNRLYAGSTFTLWGKLEVGIYSQNGVLPVGLSKIFYGWVGLLDKSATEFAVQESREQTDMPLGPPRVSDGDLITYSL